jgi:hypothetical protein
MAERTFLVMTKLVPIVPCQIVPLSIELQSCSPIAKVEVTANAKPIYLILGSTEFFAFVASSIPFLHTFLLSLYLELSILGPF